MHATFKNNTTIDRTSSRTFCTWACPLKSPFILLGSSPVLHLLFSTVHSLHSVLDACSSGCILPPGSFSTYWWHTIQLLFPQKLFQESGNLGPALKHSSNQGRYLFTDRRGAPAVSLHLRPNCLLCLPTTHFSYAVLLFASHPIMPVVVSTFKEIIKKNEQ